MTTPSDPIEPPSRRVENATCLACGLLCDDLVPIVVGGRIVEVERACDLGRAWFLADHHHPEWPAATIDGADVTVAEAIDRAAALLSNARAPLITGLSGATIETQALAVVLADRIGAVIDPGHSPEARPRVAAVQRAGAVLASFGEVKNRADAVDLWGVDPSSSHPRFWERLVDPAGRFVPGGRADRTVLVVDEGASDARDRADASLSIASGRHAETLRMLRAIVRGIVVEPDRVERACGGSIGELRRWADWLRQARYGVIVFDVALASEGPGAIEALMRLIDELNRTTRWVALALAGGGNPAGAEAVLTGRLGAPLAVDLSDGSPRFLPGDADGIDRLESGEVDAVLDIGGPAGVPALRRHVPIIRLSPTATIEGGTDVVAITCSTPGIDAGGTVVRSDEVCLPLRPALDPIRPADQDVLAAILDRLRNSEAIGGRLDPNH